MPVIVLCGLPCVGKTALAHRIASIAPTEIAPACILSDHGLADYTEPLREKFARSRLRAALERAPFRERLVIVDACNLVSGFRYELWCVSRTPTGDQRKPVPHVTILLRNECDDSEMPEPYSSSEPVVGPAEQAAKTARKVDRFCNDGSALLKDSVSTESSTVFAASNAASIVTTGLHLTARGIQPDPSPISTTEPGAAGRETSLSRKRDIDEVRRRFEWPDPLQHRWDRPLFTMMINHQMQRYEFPDGRTFSDELSWVNSILEWICNDALGKSFQPASRMSLATRQTRVQAEDSLLESELQKIEEHLIRALSNDNDQLEGDLEVALGPRCRPLQIPASYWQRLALMTNRASRLFAVSQDMKAHRRVFMRKRQKRRSAINMDEDIREYVESLESYLTVCDCRHLHGSS